MPVMNNFRVLLLGSLLLNLWTFPCCQGFANPRQHTQVIRTPSSYCDEGFTIATTTTFSSFTTKLSAHYVSTGDDEQSTKQNDGPRDKLRKVTGFSLTACRATWRAATGISLSAIYASSLAATGLYVRKFMSAILSIFPAWFRYFLQPFLILYYAPLFILRGLTGPSRARARKKRERVMDGWKDAIEYAERAEADGYWPVHVNSDGYFEAVKPPNPTDKAGTLTDAIAESVEAAMEHNNDKE